MNHSLIGFVLASSCDEPKSALPYLSGALLDLTQTHMELVMGYLNVYGKTGDYREALAMADWALGFYPGLRNSGKQSYIEKSEATLWAIRAGILLILHKKEEAADSLRKAKSIALKFDEAPDYNALNLRFVSSSKPATAFLRFIGKQLTIANANPNGTIRVGNVFAMTKRFPDVKEQSRIIKKVR